MNMTRKSKRITPQEWIQDYFAPVVSVLASNDVEVSCSKNNLTFTELLQPFAKLNTDVTFKDPEGLNHAIPALSVNFQEFRRDPTRLVNQKLLSDMVASCNDEPMVAKTFDKAATLEAPGFTPWFDLYTKLYIHSIAATEHEFFRHHVGIVLAASTASSNPVEDLRDLADTFHKHVREKPNNYPQYSTSNPLKYFVLVHDVYAGIDDARAQDMFTHVQQTFGSGQCHLLQVNSRQISTEGGGQSGNPAMVEYFLNHSHRFCNTETRREGMGATLITTATAADLSSTLAMSSAEKEPLSQQGDENNMIDHPLAAVEKAESPTPIPVMEAAPKLNPVTADNIAIHLSSNDIDRVRIFIREFCIKGLVPFLEKQMRSLFEIINNRKGRSFLSGAKRWFGQNKPGAAAGTSVVYSKEAPELQLRKLGDFYFMMKQFKNAYNCYYTCKKEFYNDEAWNYYSGATEMCALAQFMQGDTSKKYLAHYMDDCIGKYQQVCQMPEYALRATVFDAMCLKYNGMFQDAAARYIKMTSESKDMRSSLLFEQAAYCHLLSTPPSIRKYAFHIILAGYRYSKAGQKTHAARAYKQGLQIYKGKGWNLSEDHILYNIGHQSLLLKDHVTAAGLFNELLAMAKPNASSLQQMCHLREFFIVNHMKEKEDKRPAEITIPTFHPQQLVVDIRNDGNESYEQLQALQVGKTWQNVEKVVVAQIQQREVLFLSKSCQTVFGPMSVNNLKPQAVVGEKIRLMIPMENKFQTTLVLKKIRLLWKFSSNDQSDLITNEDGEANASFVDTETVDCVLLEKGSSSVLDLSLTVQQPGELFIIGVEYGIKAQFPQTEATDYTIRGKQYFTLKGPRLNTNKDHKFKATYGSDHRLSFNVNEAQAKLEVDVKLPTAVLQGELKQASFVIRNKGKAPLRNLFLAHSLPGFISVARLDKEKAKKNNYLFDFPSVSDPSLAIANEDAKLQPRSFDFIPIDVPGDVLKPGESDTINFWIRGPDTIGSNKIDLLFYYESDLRNHKKVFHRILDFKYEVNILPSVAVSATHLQPCKFQNTKGNGILLHLSNIGKMSSVQVTQVSLLSHSNELEALESQNSGFTCNKNDTTSLCLASVKKDDDDHSINKTNSELIHFSTLRAKGHKKREQDIDKWPYLSLVKAGFEFEKRRPFLKADLVVVFWETSDSVSGLSFAPLLPSPSAQEIRDMNTQIPCQVKLAVPEKTIHDFKAMEMCPVRCKLTSKNPQSSENVKFVLKHDDRLSSSEDYFVAGNVDSELNIGPGEAFEVDFIVLVSLPGLYKMSSLNIQMMPNHLETSGSTLVPLELCFLVEQSE